MDEIKKNIKPIAKKYNLVSVFLFGSYARDEATSESDIDLLVEINKKNMRPFILGGLYEDFNDIFESKVDIVSTSTLTNKKTIRNKLNFVNNILKERVKVYESNEL